MKEIEIRISCVLDGIQVACILLRMLEDERVHVAHPWDWSRAEVLDRLKTELKVYGTCNVWDVTSVYAPKAIVLASKLGFDFDELVDGLRS